MGGADGWKRVPRGYDLESPRADLLRHGGMFAGVEAALPEEVGTEAFAAWPAERMEPPAPIHRRLVEHVAGA